MKLFVHALFSLVAFPLVHGGWKVLDDTHDGLRKLSTNYKLFGNDDADGLCLGVQASVCNCRPKLALGTGCTRFRMRSNGLFESELDNDYCIQAGLSWPLEEGKTVRLQECDSSNPLQKLEYDGIVIRVIDTDMCLVWQGQTASVGDLIVAETCGHGNPSKDNWSRE